MAPVANELEAQRELFHRELMRKSMRIAELEMAVDATEARYERSLSWRLTKPLRLAQRLRVRMRNDRPG